MELADDIRKYERDIGENSAKKSTSVRLDSRTIDKLKNFADKNGFTVSSVIRYLILSNIG